VERFWPVLAIIIDAFDLQATRIALTPSITTQLASIVATMSDPRDMWKNLQKSLEQAQSQGRRCANTSFLTRT
jgi:plasmid maintenance system antidote protein VapI